jgi:3''-phosphoadenosine 5''-phosphosulfate sulfotransferase (PAPS reductase)/FAD synthetase and related enzymes
MLNIISLGAGVQSSTMALMAAHGEITPMPDCAIFADTGAEPKAVYDYLEELIHKLPFSVHIVTAGDLEKEWLYSVGRVASPPFFTQGKGILWRQCTTEYKVNPINKKLTELRGDSEVTVWVGISQDEAHRMKPNPKKWATNRWPLIELGMNRWDCQNWLVSHGYPKAPKSSCYFCPYHSPEMWRSMKVNQPKEWEKAVRFDRQLRERTRHNINEPLYLHSSLMPLDQIDFRNAEDMGQLSMFGNECEGMCGV